MPVGIKYTSRNFLETGRVRAMFARWYAKRGVSSGVGLIIGNAPLTKAGMQELHEYHDPANSICSMAG